MAHITLMTESTWTKTGIVFKETPFAFPTCGCGDMLKCQFHSRENSSEREASRGCGRGSLFLVQSILWPPFRVPGQEGWLPAVFGPRGMVARLRFSRGNATFAACSFCTGLCGFCSTVSIPPITVLQSFTKTCPGFHSMWPLIVFSQSSSRKIKGFWQLAQGRLA